MTANFDTAASWMKQQMSVSYDPSTKIFTQDSYITRVRKVISPSRQEEMVYEIAKVALSAGQSFSEQVLDTYGKKIPLSS